MTLRELNEVVKALGLSPDAPLMVQPLDMKSEKHTAVVRFSRDGAVVFSIL